MHTVDHAITPAELERTAARVGYSRLPAAGSDKVLLGYLHIEDTLGIADRDQPSRAAPCIPSLAV
ncbi:hypothetical protein GCM10010306_051690 [Streptomyces umbrinus]|nr:MULTISPECIES: hypothetical protein [Streptomyces phaeochromogenes group]GHB51606.1 hypothetical protein GCM10010306_051690 [Streptomyces umbrinus]